MFNQEAIQAGNHERFTRQGEYAKVENMLLQARKKAASFPQYQKDKDKNYVYKNGKKQVKRFICLPYSQINLYDTDTMQECVAVVFERILSAGQTLENIDKLQLFQYCFYAIKKIYIEQNNLYEQNASDMYWNNDEDEKPYFIEQIPNNNESFQPEKALMQKPSSYGKFNELTEKVLNLLAQGYPQTEIAKTLNIHRNTIRNILNRL